MAIIKRLLESTSNYLDEINSKKSSKLWFLFFLCAVSLFSIRLIPFTYKMNLLPLGYDFANPYWFQNCVEHANNPYFVAGKVCGDTLDRAMIYPPLLYWSYVWTRGLSFPLALGIWYVVLTSGIFFSIYKLPDFSFSRMPLWLYLGLMIQPLPALFALERANNDVLVMIAWTALMMSWCTRRYFVAGSLGALAFMIKLYPAVPLFILGLSLLLLLLKDGKWRFLWRTPLFKFCLGFAFSTFGLSLLFYRQNLDYFSKILPEWMKNSNGIDPTIHTIFSVVGEHPIIPLSLGLLLLISWTSIGYKRIVSDPILVFTGLLALSTYYSRISNDYNLITTFPLIALCWFRSFEGPRKNVYFYYFVASFLGPIGWRWFYKNALIHPPTAHVLYQVLWLCSFALLLRFKEEPKTVVKT